jgi:hypothetical protein
MARSACRVCDVTFTSLSGFDAHLRWSKGPPWVTHRQPADVGLVVRDGMWSFPKIAPVSAAKVADVLGHAEQGNDDSSVALKGCVSSCGET